MLFVGPQGTQSMDAIIDMREQAHLLFLTKLIDWSLGTLKLEQTVNFWIPVFNYRSVYPLYISSYYKIMKLVNEDPFWNLDFIFVVYIYKYLNILFYNNWYVIFIISFFMTFDKYFCEMIYNFGNCCKVLKLGQFRIIYK